MDKKTLSHYGWVVVLILILACMMAFAKPFGMFIADGFKTIYVGFNSTSNVALEKTLNRDINGDGIIGGGSADEDDNIIPPDDAPDGSDIPIEKYIPVGGTYTISSTNTKLIGDGVSVEFPSTPQTGDTYEEEGHDYIYKYNYAGQDVLNSFWTENTEQNGWGVLLKNLYSTVPGKVYNETPGEIYERIGSTPITNLDNTFRGCTGITTAPAIPYAVKTMDRTFYGCQKLSDITNIQIHSNVVSMSETFQGCYALTNASSITIPSSVKTLYMTFAACINLTDDGMPHFANGVETLSYTFETCTSLNDLTNYQLPNTLTGMEGAFRKCSSLVKTPYIPDSVLDMGHAFYDCTSLTDIYNLPANLMDIDYAFYQCSSLSTIPVMPMDVVYMGSTFQGCTSLNNFVGNTKGVGDFSDYVIPYGVVSLGWTFADCTGIVVAPNLSNCNSLTDMIGAFYGCTNLTTGPVIPSAVENMQGTFNGCSNLEGIIEINSDQITGYSNVFSGTTKEIFLTGSASAETLNKLASGNVKIK